MAPTAKTTNKKKPKQTPKPKQEPRYSPRGETVKLALSDVDPALTTSLPTNSSTDSQHLDYVPLVLTIGACDDGPSLLRLFVALPSLRLSCSLASWYVTFMAALLMISKMRCTTSCSSTNQSCGSFGFYLFFGMFPRLPCLPIRCGQDRVMDIFTRPTRPIQDKQFLKPPSMVTRPGVPQVIF